MLKLLVKSQVAAFTRKDGVMVQAHDSGKAAAAPKPFAAAPHLHAAGHYTVKGDGHRSVHADKATAEKLAGHLNDVHAAGRADEMHATASKLAKKHAGFETLQDEGRDHLDFKETSRQGSHAMLHEAYKAGRKKNVDASHKGAAAGIAAAAKHLPHDSLEGTNSGEDFKDTSKSSVAAALHHAFAAGHADKEKAKASSMPKRADPEATRKAGDAVRAAQSHPGPLPQKHVGIIEDALHNDEESTDKEMHQNLVANGVHPYHATEALKHRAAFLASGGDSPDHIKDMAAAPAPTGKQKLMIRKPGA